jgi:predicted metal-dependent HD superfamily phosphohydrolase
MDWNTENETVEAQHRQPINSNDYNENNHDNNSEISSMTAFLVQQLGRKRFDEAIDFLSSISERMEHQHNKGDEDDEYLLDNAERILGADGLVYLDDLFLLITHITESSGR